jgi:hypothetical protein
MPRLLVPIARAGALAALALVLAHQLVFLARYGSIYGEALVHAGHGRAWSDAVTTVVVGAAILFGSSVLGVWRLSREIRRRREIRGRRRRSDGRAHVSDPALRPVEAGPRAFARRWLTAWLGLTIVVLVALTIQENVEHALAGLRAPGLAILLSPEYPFAVAIATVVALLVALVAVLLSWRREVLIGRLRALIAAFARRRGPAIERRRSADPVVRRPPALSLGLGRRAPPSLRTA